MKRFASLFAILAATSLSACVVVPARPYAVVDVDVGMSPPPPPTIFMPAPRVGFVWAPGFYRWDGRRYLWVEGRWMHERPGWAWRPDHWEEHGGRWHYVAGHWAH